MSRKYKRYTKEFKQEAVRLAETADKPSGDRGQVLNLELIQHRQQHDLQGWRKCWQRRSSWQCR